jgi:GTP cyclohydrolase I
LIKFLKFLKENEMNYKELNKGLPDIQNNATDFIQKKIYKVGINNYHIPLKLHYPEKDVYFNTIAKASAYASLTKDKKGVNMSRFSECITESVKDNLGSTAIAEILQVLKTKLEAHDAYIKFKFDYLTKVKAPESKLESWFNIPCILSGEINENNEIRKYLEVEVNYTSLCPCSKEISEDGAHNQRSVAKITLELASDLITFEEIKEIVDDSCSCPIYNTLKRIDEKYVTERAYNNPKFSEDACREIAFKLDTWIESGKIKDYVVVTQNFESIHQSDAVAVISAGKELC